MTNKPSYEELARAFWDYLASSSLDGEGVAPEEEEVERAREILDRTGVENDYDFLPA
jgi:hypothetical protein